MRESTNIKDFAASVIREEADAVKALEGFIDDNFVGAVSAIMNVSGRVIVTGIGKSAIIASKIVATMNSTGTPAVFMHAADAMHGDLGIVRESDIIVCLSNSGNTPEIKALIPFIKSRGNKIIAMVGNSESFLAQAADFVLNTFVPSEACPNNLAPTTSTTAQLVMGDALAMTLLKLKGFTSDDFAKYHPGGALGKRLYSRVADFVDLSLSPRVGLDASLDEVTMEISSKRLGATAVMGSKGELAGIITDGDLRRMLQKGGDMSKIKAKDIMTVGPKTVEADVLAIDAFEVMEQYKITQLVALEEGKYIGMIHIHDILREGLA